MNRKILIFFLIILSIFLCFIWFRGGNFLGSGEEGLSLYYPERTARLYRYAWFETGLGFSIPVYLPRITFFGLATFLNNIFPVWLVQAGSFWFLIFIDVLGMYLLTKMLTRSEKIALVSLIFYFLNLYSQSQVWERFLYAGMFAWAYLPLFLFLWIRWLREKKIVWLAILLLTLLFFSNIFGMPADAFTFWVPVGILTIFELFRKKRNFQGILDLGFYSLIVPVLWMLTNIWWIYPYFKLGRASFSEISSWQANFDSLRGVSQYFPTDQIFLLRQSFLFGKDSLFYNFYSQPLVIGVSILILLIVVFGILTSRKEKYWLYLVTLLFIGWFISKGSNPPFGHQFYHWLFSTFPLTSVLRNPYEKLGIILLLPYSIFFALGVGWIYKRLKPKIREIVVGIVLVLSCGVLVWPMWTGDLYKSARVRVPDYYEQANQFLNQDKTDGRVLMLPIIPGDGVRYFWGYQGVEPSEFLFDKPSISKILRTKYADEKYMRLYDAFVNDKSYNQLLDEMNIKYLVLHNDLDTEISGASSSTQTKIILDKNPEISLIERIGELEIYEFKGNKDGSLFEVRGEDPPVLSYEKLSPARYRVQIGNARPRFDLIFKSTFNELWETKIDGKKLDEHFLVYDYANAWRIDRIGDYNIDIVFKVWPWE